MLPEAERFGAFAEAIGGIRVGTPLSRISHTTGLDLTHTHRRKRVQMRDIQQTDRIVPRRGTAELMTRLGDLLIACLLLAIVLPLVIIVALAIKFESTGPVLERQTCIGRGGRRFPMLNFRTTVHDPYQTIPLSARMPTRIGQ